MLPKLALNFIKNKATKSVGFDPTKMVGGFFKSHFKFMILGIVLGASIFLFSILIIVAIVSYFLGFVQQADERINNTLRGSCIFCSTEELEDTKLEQFKNKIDIIAAVNGDKIDKIVLASTVLFQGDYYSMLDSVYDEDYNEEEYREWYETLGDWIIGKEGGSTDIEEYTGIDQSEIDALDAAAIIMINSSVDGQYNEENYKEALTKNGFGSDNFLVNGVACTGQFVGQTIDAAIRSLPIIGWFVSLIDPSSGNGSDSRYAVYQTVQICQHGFIGGTFENIRQMDEGPEKEAAKREIAQNIIDFAEFYKTLFPEEDECVYDAGSVGTGDITNWRQCDEPWSNLSLGGTSNVCQIGCTATSVSYLIAKSGTKLTVPSFDPGVFVQNAGFTGGALYWDSWQKIAPNFVTIARDVPVNVSNAASVLSQAINEPCNGNHQPFIVLFLSLGHWIAFDHVENGTVYVLDPSPPKGQQGLVTLQEAYKGSSLVSYNKFCANDVEFGSTGSSSSTGTVVNASFNSSSSEYQSRLDGLSNYFQCGSNLKNVALGNTNICSAGCAVASLMAIQYMFTGQAVDVNRFVQDVQTEGIWTPSKAGMATPYFDTPDGSPTMTKNWGLSGEKLNKNIDDVINSLKQGKKVLVNVAPNNRVYSTSSGHFMMLDHYDEKTNKIYVFNPNGSNTEGYGYQSPEYITTNILEVENYGPWAISSSKATTENICDPVDSGSGDIKIPEEYGNGGYTVTFYSNSDNSWQWAENSNQGKLYYNYWLKSGAKFDNGIATYDGRYLIACTTTYGNVGDKVDFYLEDGTKIPCIIADIKNPYDPGCNEWGHNNGQNVIEFEVARAYYNQYGNPGNNGWFSEWGGKRVASASNLGSIW